MKSGKLYLTLALNVVRLCFTETILMFLIPIGSFIQSTF